ncbi:MULTISPECIES: CRISPR-associated endonuclease Cas2 [Methylococcus]|uniref:CRISPR-associated endoribonuclease Cas2 n=1 Tax=Methylococcus capsulatus TaxID=414 RepID=A0ABZ2F257_METCP|nr:MULTISPECIES: CRISPR-associated endonuclease Cas2 [Methylococcus]MDF9391723.1 CRISPR-associated endonuclease Cas2 [Methylococcus capsulatus]
MAKRTLYLGAYDVSDDTRLRAALKVLRNYSTGGQKSVFECFLSALEKRQLLEDIAGVIDLTEDRFFLIRLDPASKVAVLGTAIAPADPAYYYVG